MQIAAAARVRVARTDGSMSVAKFTRERFDATGERPKCLVPRRRLPARGSGVFELRPPSAITGDARHAKFARLDLRERECANGPPRRVGGVDLRRSDRVRGKLRTARPHI